MNEPAHSASMTRRRQEYPAAPAQRRLWFLSVLNEGSPEFNVTIAWRVRGRLDQEMLRRALQAVVERHDPLRTRLVAPDLEPVQVVEESVIVPWQMTDLKEVRPAERESAVHEIFQAEDLRPFDVATAPLLRVRVVRMDEADHAVLLVMHHLVTDGWSMGVLVREWSQAYAALTAGQPPRWKDLRVRYGEDAARLHDRARNGELENSLAWWRDKLAGLEPLEIPTDYPRKRTRDWNGGAVEAVLDGADFEELRDFARSRRTTLFTVILTAFIVVLSRYAGSSDVAVGLPVSGRDTAEVEDLIGLFFDTVVLRTEVSDHLSFYALMERVQDGLLSAYEHQEAPFDKIVEEVMPERDPGRSPLFQVWCEMDSSEQQGLTLPGTCVTEVELPAQTAKFDLSLSLRHGQDRLEMWLGYRADLLAQTSARRWQASIRHVLRQAVRSPDAPLNHLSVLPAEEERRLVGLGRGEPGSSAPHVLARFEEQAAAHPDAPAVVCGRQVLSYAQLNALAERVGRVLRGLGAGQESCVAVCLERGPELMAAFLGAWKAGAAYVPLEAAHPEDHARFIMTDTRPRVVLTQQAFACRFSGYQAPVVCLDEPRWEEAVAAGGDAQAGQDPSSAQSCRASLAYVIYTSGSSGRPKGVMIEHGALANFMQSCVDRYSLHPGGGAGLFSSAAFDAVVPNVFTPLVLGQSVHILPADLDLSELGNSLAAAGPFTFLKVTPSHLRLLTEQLTEDQARCLAGTLVVGAEAFPARLLGDWRVLDSIALVLNEYGPTEATVANSLYNTQPGDALRKDSGLLPIGVPIRNTSMFVLDQRLRPVPAGAVGEIYIGGACVARGYQGRPALTATRFVPDPFSGVPGARLYATGDMGRLLPDGNFDFLGRADDQIKISGYRIEPAEVERAAAEHPDVIAVHVGAVPAPGGQELAAWVELSAGHLPDWEADLRDHMARRLPDYLRPAHYVTVRVIPLTPHGKIDRKGLPMPVRGRSGACSRQPSGDRQIAVAAVLRELLGLERIGADDNFFALGGNSLLALHAVARLRRELRLRVGLHDLFEAPTVAGLAVLGTVAADDAATPPRTSLVMLRQGTTGIPLFCVHPSGGSVHWYQSIANVLRDDESLFAFHALDLHQDTSPPGTVAEIAQRHLRALRSVVPQGPYRLLGWSYSGVVVMEMAARLLAAGEDVAPLVLLEPTLPDPYTLRVITSVARTNRQAANLLDEIARLEAVGTGTESLRERLARLFTESEIPREAHGETSAAVLRNAAVLLEGFVAHRPAPYPGDVELLVTPECQEASAQRPSPASGISYSRYLASWQSLVRGSVGIYETNGNHKTMLDEKHVTAVADVLYGRRAATARYGSSA